MRPYTIYARFTASATLFFASNQHFLPKFTQMYYRKDHLEIHGQYLYVSEFVLQYRQEF